LSISDLKNFSSAWLLLLIFFIAGLLYLLRFERVDNLGAYRIPPETGILIPSVYNARRQLGNVASLVEESSDFRKQNYAHSYSDRLWYFGDVGR
jgi:hypothetical protein